MQRQRTNWMTKTNLWPAKTLTVAQIRTSGGFSLDLDFWRPFGQNFQRTCDNRPTGRIFFPCNIETYVSNWESNRKTRLFHCFNGNQSLISSFWTIQGLYIETEPHESVAQLSASLVGNIHDDWRFLFSLKPVKQLCLWVEFSNSTRSCFLLMCFSDDGKLRCDPVTYPKLARLSSSSLFSWPQSETISFVSAH